MSKLLSAFPSADKFDLSQKGARRFLKDLIRTSTSCYWGPVINVDTVSGIKSLLRNPRDVSMSDVRNEAERCWGKDGLVYPTEDKAVIKERALRTMVSNFILNSVTKAGIDELDLHRHDYEYFRMEQRVHVQEGPSLIKVIFDIVNPEATVSVRELKKKLGKMEVNMHGKNVKSMLTSMQMLYSEILQEGGSHEDYIDDVLAALMTVNNDEFKLEIMLMKSKRVKREPIDVREVISVATTKYHDLVTNNEYVTSKDSDVKPEFLSFLGVTPPLTTGNEPKNNNKMEDWRKKKTLDKVVKNGLVWH